MKIAFIEDDRDSSLIFSRQFIADGDQCDVYGDAESALVKIGVGTYDVLIVDIRLPGMNGVQFLARLREKEIHTPAILITAFSHKGMAKEALNASANYLLEKPFRYSALKEVVRNMILRPSSLQHLIDRGLQKLSLTPREEDAARLLLKGLSNAEIGRVASLSEKTVKQYITQIFEKAGVKSRAEFFSHIFPV